MLQSFDKQHRILIPASLLDFSQEESKFINPVALIFDKSTPRFQIKNYQDLKPFEQCHYIVKADYKNRIFIPKQALAQLDADFSSQFLLYLENNHIYIEKNNKAEDTG